MVRPFPLPLSRVMLLGLTFFFTPILLTALTTNSLADLNLNSPKTLDGVRVEAVETYWNPNQNELNLGVSLYPFNSYYQGLALNAGYLFHSTRNFAWEVVHGAFFTTFDTGLTTQLADLYNVNPETIERLQYIVSSNINYVFSYGKFVFLEDLIRYFRTSVILGVALIKTSESNYFAPNLGLKIEVFTGKTFIWKLEVTDAIAFTNSTNYVDFSLGIGLNF